MAKARVVTEQVDDGEGHAGFDHDHDDYAPVLPDEDDFDYSTLKEKHLSEDDEDS